MQMVNYMVHIKNFMIQKKKNKQYKKKYNILIIRKTDFLEYIMNNSNYKLNKFTIMINYKDYVKIFTLLVKYSKKSNMTKANNMVFVNNIMNPDK